MDQSEGTTVFLRTLARAEAKTAEEAWDEAAALWGRVVDSNPVEGRFWSRLGEARFRSEDYRGAVAAYERALELRDGFPAETAYRISCCFARLKDAEQTRAWLERSYGMGYRDLAGTREDEHFKSLHGEEWFRELTGIVGTDGLSREEGWRCDLGVLVREVKRKAYAPFRLVSEEEFDSAVWNLHNAIPKLTDVQVLVEMKKLMRMLGDGHAGVYPMIEHREWQEELPLQYYLFEEGLFVIAADRKHEALLGAQVLRIGERNVEEAITAVDPTICRDNDYWPKHVAPFRLRELPVLHALGLIPDPNQVTLTIRDLDGAVRTATLVPEPSPPIRDFRPQFPYPDGWRFFPETLSSPLPLYLKNAAAGHWFEYLREDRIVYFQFNRVRDDPAETLAAFSERLFAFTENHEVEKLVIDVRWNGGGNTFLEMPLLHRLIGCRKINRRGALFVIIGRRTFSAAQNFSTLIQRHTEAIFVGEPTGSSPTFVGETIEFELPYSKLCANVSDLLWQSSWPMDYRTWIAPTIFTPPTFAAYRANRDPAFEAILALREHLPGW